MTRPDSRGPKTRGPDTRGTDTRGTVREPAPGDELIPGYRAVERLAHGRRLDTWDAVDLARGTRCVVKLLRPDRAADTDVADALLREGEILTTVQHPHLVRCFAVVERPTPAIVLETLRGATLSAHVDEGPLPVADVAVAGLQLAAALGYLHAHGWLHLDVKPDNVVNEHGKAVLIDLSLAGSAGDRGTIGSTGNRGTAGSAGSCRPGAGTPGYLAPEQAEGEGLSPATDVWGLGVTMWECLTGAPPYGDDQTWERSGSPLRRWRRASAATLRQPLPPLPDDVPRDLADLLRGCVDLDPAARPRLVDVTAVLTKVLA